VQDDLARPVLRVGDLKYPLRALDPSLIATVEWGLERHGADAAQLLAQGMGDLDSVDWDVVRVTRARNGRRGSRKTEVLDRLFRVLKTIDSEKARGLTEDAPAASAT